MVLPRNAVLLTLLGLGIGLTAVSSHGTAETVELEGQEMNISSHIYHEIEDIVAEQAEEQEELAEGMKDYVIVAAFALLLVTYLVSFWLEERHCHVLPEAVVGVLVGMVAGGTIMFWHGNLMVHLMGFNADFFFTFLLPPIIFEAGYNMQRTAFFKNIVATSFYAFIGTFVSTFVVGGICWYAGQLGLCHALGVLPSLVFGALISATDPVTVLAVFSSLGVDVDLFSMVFGESVLNDAVAIVLYRTLMGFKTAPFSGESVLQAIILFCTIFIGSFLIGMVLALMSSVVYKYLGHDHLDGEHVFLEAAVSVLFPWISYFLAEALHLSGIVAIMFCGIGMAHYTFNNMSPAAQILTRQMFKVMAYLSETFVFIYIGMSFFAFPIFDHLVLRFVAVAIIACFIGRVLNIFPNSALVNAFRSEGSIPAPVSFKFQFLMWWSGLRGGVAFAIAATSYAQNDFPENGDSLAILQATLTIATFTIFVFGGSITDLCIYFKVLTPKDAVPKEDKSAEMHYPYLVQLDRHVIKPMLTRASKPPTKQHVSMLEMEMHDTYNSNY